MNVTDASLQINMFAECSSLNHTSSGYFNAEQTEFIIFGLFDVDDEAVFVVYQLSILHFGLISVPFSSQ